MAIQLEPFTLPSVELSKLLREGERLRQEIGPIDEQAMANLLLKKMIRPHLANEE
jgi:hypothetical protein